MLGNRDSVLRMGGAGCRGGGRVQYWRVHVHITSAVPCMIKVKGAVRCGAAGDVWWCAQLAAKLLTQALPLSSSSSSLLLYNDIIVG